MPTKHRPPTPPPHPPSPTKQALALRVLPQVKAPYPDLRGHCLTADALYGTAPFVDGASALFGGVQVISQLRHPQNIRVSQHEQHVADDFAPPPGTPHTLRIRGGEEVVALIGSAWLYGCSHKTTRCIVAMKSASEETDRSLMAADLTGRTLDIVQGQTLRWLVAVVVQDWKSSAGWSQLPKQPGAEGARRRVILRLRVAHCLFFHPDQRAQLTHNLPASTVGSLRAHVQVACLVHVIDNLVVSEAPQEQLHRFTHAFHQLFAFGRSTKHMIQRQLGRLEPTPSLKDRADEVMRNMPTLST